MWCGPVQERIMYLFLPLPGTSLQGERPKCTDVRILQALLGSQNGNGPRYKHLYDPRAQTHNTR